MPGFVSSACDNFPQPASSKKQLPSRGSTHSLSYIHLPFNKKEYQTIDPQDRKAKIRYVMNTNGARNAALREGKTLAEWVLPLDGSCFFDDAGWASYSLLELLTTSHKFLQILTTSYNFLQLLTASHNFSKLLTTSYVFLQLLTTSYSFSTLLITSYNFLQLLTTSYNFLQLLTTSHNFLQLVSTSYNFVNIFGPPLYSNSLVPFLTTTYNLL